MFYWRSPLVVKLLKTMKRKNIFRTFLLYSLVFTLPFALFLAAAYFKTFETLSKHDEERNISRLSFIEDEIEEKSINLLNVFNRIASSKWVSILYYENMQDLYNINEGSVLKGALNELKNFTRTNSEVLLSGIYYINGNFIIDNYSRISEATSYFKNHLIIEGTSVNSWYKYTAFRHGFSIFSNTPAIINERKYDALTFIKTIPSSAEKPKAVLFTVIKKDALKKMFAQYNLNREQIALIDKSKGVLFNSGIQDIELNRQEAKNAGKVISGNRLYYKDIKTLPWTIIYSAPVNSFYGNIGFEKNVIMLFVFIFSLGLLAVYLISVYVNKPVTLASSSLAGNPDIWGNDFIIIEKRIDFLNQKQKTLNRDENSFKPAIFELFFFHLIHGNKFVFPEIKLREEFEDIYFKDGITFVISIKVNSSHELSHEILAEILKLLLHIKELKHLYIRDLQGNDVFLIKATLNKSTSHDIILKKMGLSVQNISSKRKISVYTGGGCVCKGIEDIYKSYLTSIENLKYNILTGKPGNTEFIDFSIAGKRCYINFHNEEELLKNIELGETRLLENNLNRMLGIPGTPGTPELKSDSNEVMPPAVCEFIYSQLISIIIRFADKSKKYYIINCPRFLSLQSIGDATEYIKEVCEKERIYQEQNASANNTQDIRRSVLDFINENYLDGCMSLKQINEKFGISFSLITKIIKDSSGMGFSNYISRKRIGYAKKLLKDPKYKISEISKLSGYYDESTFIRVFKKIEGVTPGNYRENLR